MHVDATEISLFSLTDHLHDVYGLLVTTIECVPKGEDADAYRATARDGARYFVRVQRCHASEQQEAIFAALTALHAEGGLGGIVVPFPTRSGHFVSQLQAHTVVLFPFVDGTTAYDRTLSEPHCRQLAAFMANLHASEAPIGVSALPCETFSNPFAPTIAQALQRAGVGMAQPSLEQQKTIELLRAERTDLEATVQRFDRLGAQAQQLEPALVPTHGDPNLANVLLDYEGTLYLIDWGALALGPRERDLMFFLDDRFATFMEAYLAHAGSVQLHLELFTFYLYRWALQEIADYASHLLLVPTDADGQVHAWQELQPYLPVPHAAIATEVENVRQMLVPFVHTGQVKLSRAGC